MRLRFQDSTHLVAHPVEHVADGALVRKFFRRVVLVLDQHFSHGFGGQTRVLEKPLEFRVRLGMRLDQIDDVFRQLRVGLFGVGLVSARRIGNDLAGIAFLDSPGDSVPGPAKDGFGEPRMAAQIVLADASLKSPPPMSREFPGSIAHRFNRFRGQFFHHSPP